jgi:hypothetical protein
MNSSSDQSLELPPYAVALLIFSIWMLIDAYKRRAELYWIAIILLLPFGSIVYFALVKVRDFLGEKRPLSGHQPAPELGELRPGQGTKNPGQALAQADQLEERGNYDEAIRQYQVVLGTEPQNLHAMHGMARCLLGKGEADAAVGYLEKVVESDREFGNYSAALDYAEALWQAQRKNDCIELVEALATHTARFNHRVALAHYLSDAGRVAAARQVLAQVLAEYSNADPSTQLKDRRWAEKAEKMLAESE